RSHVFRIARRRHDGDQGRIGALHHAYVRGKRDVAQVLRVVDLEAGNVDVERFRNVVGGTLHFDGVGDDVDGAAALDPRRLLRIDHVDRDAHADARTLAEAKEIDVHRQILHRIELVIARDYALLAAVEIELVDRGEEAAGIDALLEIGMIDRHVERRLAVAVDHAGHAAGAAFRTSGAFAGPRTRDGLHFLDRCHRTNPHLCNG